MTRPAAAAASTSSTRGGAQQDGELGDAAVHVRDGLLPVGRVRDPLEPEPVDDLDVQHTEVRLDQ